MSGSDFFSEFRYDGKTFHICDLQKVYRHYPDVRQFPTTLKILLENGIRHTPRSDQDDYISHFINAYLSAVSFVATFHPGRILMQDFTGVPAVVDLAVMREAVSRRGGNPGCINPHVPVDLVIDHSVTVDDFGNPQAFARNVAHEFQRNDERYTFLKWAQQSFANFRVVPPGTGICHQVNLEYLSTVVHTYDREGLTWLVPDTVVGTDSHTTMINGLGVLGWGVGGIEAEAAMLNQPIPMEVPPVVGVDLRGTLRAGVTATDLVLTLTELLRKAGVVGKFVEFFGEGLSHLTLEDRATVSNMCPEFGATVAYFPIDQRTCDYLTITGRVETHCSLVESYARHQGIWCSRRDNVQYSQVLSLDLGTVVTCLAGPNRPQDRVALGDIPASLYTALAKDSSSIPQRNHADFVDTLTDGDVVLAAITSCTNTSNPSTMLAAGLLARNAHAKGLRVKSWVKTSFAPGSGVVSDYMAKAGLQKYLDALGFYLVGYGCTSCIGNSGPLSPAIAHAIDHNNLSVAAILSGNRNFEGRVHPQTKLNYLASPPLVIAYALVGNLRVDITTEPLGVDSRGNPVYLADIWPSSMDIQKALHGAVKKEMFTKRYAQVFEGTPTWKNIPVTHSDLYAWDAQSTYVRCPPYFEEELLQGVRTLVNASVLLMLGDSITTDHISPAGAIAFDSPAATYLQEQGVPVSDFNSYGARRGNHEVMMRGTFANVRLQNELTPHKRGSWTYCFSTDKEMDIFEASKQYRNQKIPTIVVAGKEYGSGSSRDWAAKGPKLLGVRAVIAETFERIHRSNLVGMGILPLTFTGGQSRKTLGLSGHETWTIPWSNDHNTHGEPRPEITATLTRAGGEKETIRLQAEVYTDQEYAYLAQGGILPYVVYR
ncbi:MAG: aconitate hydratase AcnA [Alphaproteobacteria bacterium]|nr:MAG: aconitate hydratase AcnA [Alphaproteobacteria bacterium]